MSDSLTEPRQRIRQQFLDHYLTTGQYPVSIYAFAKQLGITEADFYKYYASFASIESEVWTEMIESSIATLLGDPAFAGYSFNEKLLSFYFTFFEQAKGFRSFIMLSSKPVGASRLMPGIPTGMRPFKKRFESFIDGILNEGFDKGEVVARSFISDRYTGGLWMQFNSLIRFWANDASPEFEDTDAAIEKSVRLSAQLMGDNVFDAAADLVKFFVQRRFA